MRAGRSAGIRALFRLSAPVVCRTTWQELVRLRGLERADPGDLRARQEARLRDLIAWAYATVPYYTRIMNQVDISPADIRGIEDLRALPILRRADIRASASDMVSRQASARDWMIKTSSGTTGLSLRFYRDRRAVPFEQANLWQAQEWAGVTPVDRMLIVMPPTDQYGHSNITRWKRLCGGGLVPYEPLQRLEAPPVLAAVDAVAPEVVHGPPSLLSLLARVVLRAGYRLRTRPRCISYSGEQMGEETRRLLTQAFDAPIFSRYGATELSGSVAQTCELGRRHLNTEGFIVEVVTGEPGDPQGAAAGSGRLIITDLRNRVMPFIRYEIGDMGAAGDGAGCPCGRTLSLLGALEGRVGDFIITPSGRRFPVTTLLPVIRKYLEIFYECQFRQDRPDELVLFIVPTNTYSREAAQGLAQVLTADLGGEVLVTVEAVERIAHEPSGKRPLVKSTLHQGR
jgi:phenylacetate-CoA ligase